MSQNVLIWLALLALTVVSCLDKANRADPVDIPHVEILIDHEAGMSWTTGEVDFIASPVNVGSYQGTTVLILSDAIAKGSRLEVTPLGVAVVEEGGKVNNYVVAVPSRSNNQSIRLGSFEELITKYSSAKWIIEQYLVSRNGMGSAKLQTWHDQDYVLSKLWKE